MKFVQKTLFQAFLKLRQLFFLLLMKFYWHIQYIRVQNQQKHMEQRRQADQIKEQQQRQEQQYDSFVYKFQQQIIDAWKPVPYTQNNVILYAILTIICVTLGLVLILTAPTTPQIQLRYDNASNGQVEFTLTEDLAQPVYLYYGLTNYYQNHRRYLKFFMYDQMTGTVVSDLTTAQAGCGTGLTKNKDVYPNQTILSFDGTALSAEDIAFPCGARAKSYLQIKPQIQSISLKYANGTNIALNKTNIAWPDDKNVYSNSENPSQQIIDNQDQSWLVWFRPAARNNFFKLHSRIESDLAAGNYTFSSNNIFTAPAGCQKYFHLSKSNYVGNKDLFLGIAFLSLGGGCLIVLIVFIAKCVTERRERPKYD